MKYKYFNILCASLYLFTLAPYGHQSYQGTCYVPTTLAGWKFLGLLSCHRVIHSSAVAGLVPYKRDT